MHSRSAIAADAATIAAIYNEGIADGIATFETRPRTPDDILRWLGTPFPVVVVQADGSVIASAPAS